MKRGDVVRVADGKPRPDAPIYRIPVEPDARNGLLVPSQLMVDRTGPVRRDRIDGVIGRLGSTESDRLAVALAMIFDLGR